VGVRTPSSNPATVPPSRVANARNLRPNSFVCSFVITASTLGVVA
jgi:hypothetical protein